jgi:hypothetical protein
VTNNELDTVIALTKVRLIRAELEALDAMVGPIIQDEEHAQMRRTARAWETKLQDSLTIRRERSDKGAAR